MTKGAACGGVPPLLESDCCVRAVSTTLDGLPRSLDISGALLGFEGPRIATRSGGGGGFLASFLCFFETVVHSTFLEYTDDVTDEVTVSKLLY